MQQLSINSPKNVTIKIHRPREIISRKWVAYQELISSETNYSQRVAAKVLQIPRSTFQYWNESYAQNDELDNFFYSPAGVKALHRIISAAYFVIQFRNCGSRGLQEFIKLAGLNSWVAHSTGAVHNFASHFETEIVAFANEQRQALAQEMPLRKIVISEDETFHMGRPCLVAIELISNYILVEKYAEQRRAEDWNLAMNESLEGLNVKILSSTTDGGTALMAHVKKELGVEHSPDLFHVQQDLSRATAAPLKSQEREMEKEIEKGERKLKSHTEKHGENSEIVKQTKQALDLKKYGLELRRARRENVKTSIKGIGQDYHPIDLITGEWLSPDIVKRKLEAHVEKVEVAAREAKLADNCLKKIAKAKEQIAPIISYLKYFFLLIKQLIEEEDLTPEMETFFREILMPLAYLEWAFTKRPIKERQKVNPILEKLRRKAREGPLQEEEREKLQRKATEWVRYFQRSSSCVEGRNGVLGMKHHGAHKLSARRLGALTAVHNFHMKRLDGTTPGERFFQKKHDELFEVVISRVKMLGKPRKRRFAAA